MKDIPSENLEGKCEHVIGDFSRHYCEKLPNTGEHPGNYQRVFCWGQKNGLHCESALDEYVVKG